MQSQKRKIARFKGSRRHFLGQPNRYRPWVDMEHIQQFVTLHGLLSDVNHSQQVPDNIIWKFTNDGKYPIFSACKMQFEGLSPRPQCSTLKGLDLYQMQFFFCKVGHAK
jgi:hypothetical protein